MVITNLSVAYKQMLRSVFKMRGYVCNSADILLHRTSVQVSKLPRGLSCRPGVRALTAYTALCLHSPR